MIDWYHTLPFYQQIFAGITIGFGAVLTLLMVGSVAGGDVDLDADVDVEVDGGAFSIKGILTFLTFFGLGGWVMLRAGSPAWLATVVGFGTGYAASAVLLFFLAKLKTLDTDGSRKADALLHQEGTVYLTIPASGQGVGRIQVPQGSRLVEVEAVTTGPTIKSGERVRVVEVLSPGKVRVEALRRVTGGPSFKTFGP